MGRANKPAWGHGTWTVALFLALVLLLAGMPLWAQDEAPGDAVGPDVDTGEAAPGEAITGDEPVRRARMVRVRTAYGTSFDAYLAGPDEAPLGVVLVHDRWGLNPQVKAWADRIANLGHRVLAVDLYDGRPVGKPNLGLEVWRSIDPVWTEANLDAALAFMRASHGRLVVLGWGKGIGPVGDLARRSPGALAGLVLYYDADTLGEARHLPPRPAMPVLDITVARSLAHPHQDPTRLEGGSDEVWQATSQFLARFAE